MKDIHQHKIKESQKMPSTPQWNRFPDKHEDSLRMLKLTNRTTTIFLRLKPSQIGWELKCTLHGV